jgi:hypothetical protein
LAGRYALDLRYDYLNQNQLRQGSGKADRAALTLPNDKEIQQGTRSHVITATLDYALDPQWHVSGSLPYIDLFHTTIAPGDTDISTSSSKAVGDARVLARYAGLNADGHTRLTLGLKLPTGRFHDTFNGGPQAGEGVDRGLQPGTGTTDLIAGIGQSGMFDTQTSWFGQLQWQQALAERKGFKPSANVTLNLGLRYANSDRVATQLQLSLRREGRESGINADRDNSGSTQLQLSPGVTLTIDHHWQAYGFVQLPLYQHVNGLQLLPRAAATMGLRYSL